MKKIVLVIVMVNVLGSLVACSGKIPATEVEELASEEPYSYYPTLSPKPDWLVRWLNEPVCQPPCWENITPSETSYTNALAIAKTILGFELGYVNEDSIQLNYNSGYVLLLPHGDENIQEIRLTTRYTSLELSEIVDPYGFPDYMLQFSSHGDQHIDLLYYDLGMVITFDALPNDPWNKVSLGPDIYIGTISFYAQQLEYYFNSSKWLGMVVSPAVKLNGYGDYDIPEGELYPLN